MSRKCRILNSGAEPVDIKYERLSCGESSKRRSSIGNIVTNIGNIVTNGNNILTKSQKEKT